MGTTTAIKDFYNAEGVRIEKVMAVKVPHAYEVLDAMMLPVKGIVAVLVDDPDMGKLAVKFEVSSCWAKYDSATVRRGGRDSKAGTPWCIGSKKVVRGGDVDFPMLERLAESRGSDPFMLLYEDDVIRKVIRATRAAYNKRRGKR